MRSLGAIFIDSSAFFAALVTRDPAHALSLSLLSRLREEKRRLCTTDHVIAETFTLLRARNHDHLCRNFHDTVQNSRGLLIEMTSSERFWQTSAFFLRHADKGYSFTDCLSFVVMRELKLTEALTTDRHFDQAGFRALLAGTD